MKKYVFQHIFLIQDIFHKNSDKHLIFCKLIDKVLVKGTVKIEKPD